MIAGIIRLYCVATTVAVTTQRMRMLYTPGLLLTGVVPGAWHVVACRMSPTSCYRDFCEWHR